MTVWMIISLVSGFIGFFACLCTFGIESDELPISGVTAGICMIPGFGWLICVFVLIGAVVVDIAEQIEG